MNEPTTQYHGAFAAANQEGAQDGLNKLEYLAATAPDTIPEWFRHSSAAKPKFQGYVPSYLEASYTTWRQDGADCSFREHFEFHNKNAAPNVPQAKRQGTSLEAARQIDEADLEHYEAVQRWQRQDAISRYFQWRVFYARNLLSELEKV